ncbi:lambda exonuclease family protein [Neisseria sp. Ec49-e6-T10]|uniref:lambda exonuclease family protein n=1 Tax=Neisseria sp. Ec49-e6-T10 TaxID=3140744 RepID=UPI003EB76B01
MEQRTDDWYQTRLGKVTASNVHKIMAKGKGGAPSDTRKKYMLELLGERLEGVQAESFQSDAMRRGTELEPLAKSAFSIETGEIVEDVFFVPHPSIKNFGASPDGLINDDCLIEIKCPNRATHLDSLLNGSIKREYMLQMYTQMACTQRGKCYFVSYYPNLGNESLFIKLIERDNEAIKEIEEAVTIFLDELFELENRLKNETP